MKQSRRRTNRVRLIAALLMLALLAACGSPKKSEQPSQFEFGPVVNAERGSVHTSNVVTLSGFTGGLTASVSEPGVLIVNGSDAEGSTRVVAGDRIQVRLTASNEYESAVSALVTVGSVTAEFSVTTKAEPEEEEPGEPSQFEFGPVVNAERGSVHTSNVVTLSGFTGELAASVSEPGVLLVTGDEVEEPVEVVAGDEIEVVAGDRIQVRLTASNEYESAVSALVTVGSVTAEFRVTTKAEPIEPTAPQILSFEASESAPMAGTEITLTWQIEGDVDSIELTADVDWAEIPELGLGDESVMLQVPLDAPEVTYTLTVWNNALADGDDADTRLELGLWVCSISNAEYDPIVIEDDALRESVLEWLSFEYGEELVLTADDLTCEEMQKLTEISTSVIVGEEGDIESLNGLQHASNLETLELNRHAIGDLGPLARIDSLEVLRLDQNRVILDLSPLAQLPNLLELALWDVGPLVLPADDEEEASKPEYSTDGLTVEDVEPLAALTQLEALYLSNNNLTHLEVIQDMDGLRVLYALNNSIEDLSPLAGKADLAALLLGFQRPHVTGQQQTLGEVALEDLTSLRVLGLEFHRLQSTGVLSALGHLWEIRLNGNRLTEVSGLMSNANFPESGAAEPEEEEVGPSSGAIDTPRLSLAFNCLDVSAGSATADWIANLRDNDVTVTGEDPNPELCGGGVVDGAVFESLRRKALQEFMRSGDYR